MPNVYDDECECQSCSVERHEPMPADPEEAVPIAGHPPMRLTQHAADWCDDRGHGGMRPLTADEIAHYAPYAPFPPLKPYVKNPKKESDLAAPQISSTEVLLAERGKTHGDFKTNSQIAQDLKDVVRPHLAGDPAFMREAVDMILHKIARACAGDPDFADHWRDIAGYAKLVADRCTKG